MTPHGYGDNTSVRREITVTVAAPLSGDDSRSRQKLPPAESASTIVKERYLRTSENSKRKFLTFAKIDSTTGLLP